MLWRAIVTSTICFTSPCLLYSQTIVQTSTDLQNAIIAANAGGENTIDFNGPGIDLTVSFGALNLRPLNASAVFTPTNFSITINGNGNNTPLFSGGVGNPHRGFFAFGGTVNLNDITFNQLASKGGDGGSYGGGGGAGIGGSLIVGTGANVTATACIFQNSFAQGGDGGIAGDTAASPTPNPNATQGGAGGGGGLAGNGGIAGSISGGGGGGLDNNGGGTLNTGITCETGSSGGGGVGFPGGIAGPNYNAGNGGNNYANLGGGDAGATFSDPGSPGSTGGGGGAGYASGCQGNVPGGNGGAGGIGGGGGGGGSGSQDTGTGGNGGDYGGGGGGANSTSGGQGGFAGGGGCAGQVFFNNPVINGAPGGNGGFGGGGGGGGGSYVGTTPGAGGISFGGFGGIGGTGAAVTTQFYPSSPSGGGGGGAGMGGAIFIKDGGTLTLAESVTFGSGASANMAIGGSGGAPSGQATGGTDGSAAGNDIFIMSSGQLNFNLTSSLTLNNPIEGDQGTSGSSSLKGGLVQNGPALVVLTGDNTYTGTTTINAGELRIDGSVVTDVSVQVGGTLSGNCSILSNALGTNSGNLINSGTVSPGDNELGVISVAGNFINDSLGIFAVGITPASNGLLNVDGMGILGGTLEVFVNSGQYVNGTRYEIINGTTIGAFDKLITMGPGASYVLLDVSYGSAFVTVLDNPIFTTIFPSSIANSVAGCIASAAPFTSPDFLSVVTTIGTLPLNQLNLALIKLSPVNYGALDWINERNNSAVQDIIAEHLFELCCSPRDCTPCSCNASIWIDVFGNLMSNHKQYDNLSPFRADAVGLVTGLDYCFCENFTFGGAFAYSHTWLNWKRHLGHGNIDSYTGALYGSYEGCLTVDLAVLGGGSHQHLRREINIRGTNTLTGDAVLIDRSAKANPWGYFFNGHLGLRADWDWCCTTFEPFGIFTYNYFHRQGFTEHGADSLDLKVRGHNENMIRGEAGLRAYRTWSCNYSCFAPYLGLSWVGEFPMGHSKQKASFIGQSCVIDASSYHSSVQLVSPQAGIKWTSYCGISFSVGYKGLYNSKTNINEVDGRIEWDF